MRKLLHIIDDPKFINMCKETFDIDNVENYYLKSGLVTVDYLSQNEIDVLFIHFLREPEINFLNSHKLSVPVVWFFWGADGFRLGKFYNKFLLPKTKKLKLKLAFYSGLSNGLKELQKRFLPTVIDATSFYRKNIQALSKIDVIVPVMPGDYYLLKEAYNISAKLFHFNYVVPVSDEVFQVKSQKNILLGNSADFSNNHIEIIDKLAEMDLENRKVYVPLSYGNRQYAEYIKSYVEKRIPGNGVCLMEFLDLESYQNIIRSCGIVLMNHLRQQALANIVQALVAGARVYLHPESTVFHFLKENKFIFSDITDISHLNALDQDQRDQNRMRCKIVFGKSTQRKKACTLISRAKLI